MSGNPLKVYTGGTFDLLHIGHVNFLSQCARHGEVSVSLNTDEFISEYKGSAPIYSYEERKALLELLPSVKQVIPNIGGSDSKLAIETIKPDVIAIGSDWARRDYYTQMDFDQNWLDDHDISLLYIPYTPGISSSSIKKRVIDRILHHYKSCE